MGFLENTKLKYFFNILLITMSFRVRNNTRSGYTFQCLGEYIKFPQFYQFVVGARCKQGTFLYRKQGKSRIEKLYRKHKYEK